MSRPVGKARKFMADIAALRAGGDEMRRAFLRYIYGTGFTMNGPIKHRSLRKAVEQWDTAVDSCRPATKETP